MSRIVIVYGSWNDSRRPARLPAAALDSLAIACRPLPVRAAPSVRAVGAGERVVGHACTVCAAGGIRARHRARRAGAAGRSARRPSGCWTPPALDLGGIGEVLLGLGFGAIAVLDEYIPHAHAHAHARFRERGRLTAELWRYNFKRPHGSLAKRPPGARLAGLNNVLGSYN